MHTLTQKQCTHRDKKALYTGTTLLLFTDRGSHSPSSKALTVTLSAVVAVAVPLGTILFAFTMWRIRSKRLHSLAQTGPFRARREARGLRRCCVVSRALCVCRARRKRAACHGGSQLQTIQARDKNGRLFPLHAVIRDANSGHSDLKHTSPLPIPRPHKTEDLPYGYISHADINIPQLRNFTISENSSPLKSRPTHQQHYMNVDAVQRDSQVACEETNYDDPIHLSGSVYPVPSSFSAGTDGDAEYDNSQHYLHIVES